MGDEENEAFKKKCWERCGEKVTVGGNVNPCSHLDNSMEPLQKTENRTII